MELLSIIVSIVVSLVTAFVTTFIAIRKVFNSVIAPERCKWRDNLKQTIININLNEILSIEKAIDTFILNLNPFDDADNAIINQLKHIKELVEKKEDFLEDWQEVMLNLSYLFKHDWERQKHESSFFPRKKNEPKRAVLKNKFFCDTKPNIRQRVCCGRACLYENRYELIELPK